MGMMDRRAFLGAGALAAAAGASNVAKGAAEVSTVKTGGRMRRFVAACPPSSKEYGSRRPGPPRVMVIGAHPDDADILCGGTAVTLVARGFKVKFVSVTDGRMGHHRLSQDETAKIRRAETLEAARRFGLDGYDIYGYLDCGLYPTDEARRLVARKIREYEPDFVFTHRTCDYHADHRATARLVLDASYMIRVPQFCADTPIPEQSPIFAHPYDSFTDPRPLRPDVMVPIDDVMEEKCRMVECHASQIYEWLAWERNRRIDPSQWTWEEKRDYILANWGVRNEAAADLGRARLVADLGEAGTRVRYAEAYEWSPYGCRNSGGVEELRRLLTA